MKDLRTPTYRSWEAMKRRCNSPTDKNWENYGGRGITYDSRWGIFKLFLEDMGVRPEGTTLDRKDSNGNYCKDNCRWATPKQQAENQKARTKHPLNHSGVLGVRWIPARHKWQADYKNKYIGLYSTIVDAVAARLRAERESNN